MRNEGLVAIIATKNANVASDDDILVLEDVVSRVARMKGFRKGMARSGMPCSKEQHAESVVAINNSRCDPNTSTKEVTKALKKIAEKKKKDVTVTDDEDEGDAEDERQRERSSQNHQKEIPERKARTARWSRSQNQDEARDQARKEPEEDKEKEKSSKSENSGRKSKRSRKR